jgi:hypothetical protein
MALYPVLGRKWPVTAKLLSVRCHAMVPVYCGALIAVVTGAKPVIGFVTKLVRLKSFTVSVSGAVAGKVMVTTGLPAALVA